MTRLVASTIEERARAFRVRLEGWLQPLDAGDQLLVMDWVERALEGWVAGNGDALESALISAMVDGYVAIAGVRDGHVLFRIVDAATLDLLRMLIRHQAAEQQLLELGGAELLQLSLRVQ